MERKRVAPTQEIPRDHRKSSIDVEKKLKSWSFEPIQCLSSAEDNTKGYVSRCQKMSWYRQGEVVVKGKGEFVKRGCLWQETGLDRNAAPFEQIINSRMSLLTRSAVSLKLHTNGPLIQTVSWHEYMLKLILSFPYFHFPSTPPLISPLYHLT